MADYYQKNKESISQTQKEYYQFNKDKIHERQKKWQKANIEKFSSYQSKYAKDNKHKVNSKESKRRALKLNATPKWLTEYALMAIECKYSVASMLNKYGVEKWDVDHIYPLKGKDVCGFHVPSNLQVIPAKKNREKGNKLI